VRAEPSVENPPPSPVKSIEVGGMDEAGEEASVAPAEAAGGAAVVPAVMAPKAREAAMMGGDGEDSEGSSGSRNCRIGRLS
jgi:hypothetical protein